MINIIDNYEDVLKYTNKFLPYVSKRSEFLIIY